MKPLRLARASIVALVLASSGFAFAQGAPSAGAGIPPAPVGHRQPTASDVPAGDSVKGGEPGLPGDKGGADTFGPALSALPKLDVKATCRRAQPLSAGEKSAYQSCLDDEIAAQKTLSHSWFSFKAGPRTTCTQETRIGGAPSYVELVTCLELQKEAVQAEADNRKALRVPTSPAPAASPAPTISPGTP